MSEPTLRSAIGPRTVDGAPSVAAGWIEEAATRDLLELTARRTLDCEIRIWSFGVGLALTGLVAAGQILERADLIQHVGRLVAPALGVDPEATDHLISVESLAALSAALPEIDHRDATRRFVRALQGAPRPVPGRPAVHRPDLPQWSSTVWVDCMHTDGPGLVLAGDTDAAFATMGDAASVLQDRSGLFCHGYDVATGRTNGVHWGRGQGWALHGLVATAAAGGGRTELRKRAELLLSALSRHEESGRWRAVVDREDSPFESSTSALVAEGVILGLQSGVVDPSWSGLGRRAARATVEDLVKGEGGLAVSAATPIGPPESYDRQPSGVFPWGQGPALCSLAMLLGWRMPGAIHTAWPR